MCQVVTCTARFSQRDRRRAVAMAGPCNNDSHAEAPTNRRAADANGRDVTVTVSNVPVRDYGCGSDPPIVHGPHSNFTSFGGNPVTPDKKSVPAQDLEWFDLALLQSFVDLLRSQLAQLSDQLTDIQIEPIGRLMRHQRFWRSKGKLAGPLVPDDGA